MTKNEFIIELRKRLNGLPNKEIDDRVNFYIEMIADRVEDGKTESEAIEDLGGLENVVNEILGETKLISLVKEKIKPKRRISGLEITLLILGFPLWFPLLIVGLVLVLVFYILMWTLIIVTYSVETALLGSAVVGLMGFFTELTSKTFNYYYLGIGISSIGAFILFIFVCLYATKANVFISKKALVRIKSLFIKGDK